MQQAELLNLQDAIHSLKRRRKFGVSLSKLFSGISKLEAILETEGLHINTSCSSYALELYSRIGQGLQKAIVRDFNMYVGLLESMKAKSQDLWDSQRLTWAFLKERSLQPCYDTFAAIEDNDIIEIYNRDYIQIFRNLQFFREFDCPIFDLLILDWTSLFKRPIDIQEKIFIQMQNAFRSYPKVRSFSRDNSHLVEPRFYEERSQIELGYCYRSPLISRARRSRRVEMLLLTSKVTSRLPFESAFRRAV